MKDVWPFEGDLGYRRAIDGGGSVVAPLLAGFSFTLFVLLLPTLSPERTVVATPHGVRLISESHGFSAVPEVAASLLLLAGLLFVFSVQAAVFLRLHSHKPSDFFEWYPEYFPHAAAAPQSSTDLPQWSTADWPAASVAEQWYGGWPRRHLSEEVNRANKWAQRTRLLYQGGILALLVGLTALVWPPAGDGDVGRWIITGVGGIGVAVEAGWMGALSLAERSARRGG